MCDTPAMLVDSLDYESVLEFVYDAAQLLIFLALLYDLVLQGEHRSQLLVEFTFLVVDSLLEVFNPRLFFTDDVFSFRDDLVEPFVSVLELALFGVKLPDSHLQLNRLLFNLSHFFVLAPEDFGELLSLPLLLFKVLRVVAAHVLEPVDF